MTINKGIFIRNIYYMLSYAFQELRRNNYADIAGEQFDDTCDLYAEILYRGTSYQLKQGLHKEYVERHDALATMRGKLDMVNTIRERTAQRRRLACEYDELSVDNTLNQIVKATICLLLKKEQVRNSRKQRLRSILPYLTEVSNIHLGGVKWKNLRFDRNTRTYQMLVYLCYFISDGLLLSTDTGDIHMPMFSDDHMCRLYEKFILEYYRRHHPELRPSAKHIDWNIKEDVSSISMLPIMQSDIYLTNGDKTLIIDAKYYQKSMQVKFNKATVHSPNLYQILAYVNNEDANHTGKVDGVLLYAKTTEETTPDGSFTQKDGNTISFKTLDLDNHFDKICEQLEKVVKDTFGE